MPKVEVKMCRRDKYGNKLRSGEKLRFRTNNFVWLAERCEREANRGVPRSKRDRAKAKFFGCEVDDIAMEV